MAGHASLHFQYSEMGEPLMKDVDQIMKCLLGQPRKLHTNMTQVWHTFDACMVPARPTCGTHMAHARAHARRTSTHKLDQADAASAERRELSVVHIVHY